MELAYPQVIKNDLGIDLANSFWFLRTNAKLKSGYKLLAQHYSLFRKPYFRKRGSFRPSNTISVLTEKLNQAEFKDIKHSYSVKKSEKYIDGTIFIEF